VINGDVLFATTGLSLLAELRFRLKGGYGYVSVWAHVFFLKYNPLRAHADCRIRIELRSRSRSGKPSRAIRSGGKTALSYGWLSWSSHEVLSRSTVMKMNGAP